jgi:WD40 repeat protein
MLNPTIAQYLEANDVSPVELEALDLALAGQPADRIAEQLAISPIAVRKRMASVYRKLHIVGQTHGKLIRLREKLEAISPTIVTPTIVTPTIVTPTPETTTSDPWQASALVESGTGRGLELALLQGWMGRDGGKLIVLWGLGGVGKTTLAMQVTQQVERQFETVIWRSLQDTPSLDALLESLLISPAIGGDRLGALIQQLTQQRTLLVLDNWDALLADRSSTGEYRSGYAEYGTFLQQVSEQAHNSCVLITSREKPKELAWLEGKRSHAYQVLGLPAEAAARMLVNLAVFDQASLDRQVWAFQELVDRCGGNPLKLKIVATLIRDVFGGDIEQFLKQGNLGMLSQIEVLIEQQLKRLSALELEILGAIALNAGAIRFAGLLKSLLPTSSNTERIEALQSLQHRALIDYDNIEKRYRLHPVMREYLISQLTEQAVAELLPPWSSKTGVIASGVIDYQAFYKAPARYQTRRFQKDFLLLPLVQRLRQHYGNDRAIDAALMERLADLRGKTAGETGFQAGNLINLILQLTIDHRGADFSRLAIQQVSFRLNRLRDVDLSYSQCHRCTFQGVLGSVLTIAFHPTKPQLISGDSNGQITCWDLQSGEQIRAWKAHSDWIRALVYGPNGDFIVSAGDDRRVKIWDSETRTQPKILRGHESEIHSLALHAEGQLIASSSRDGTVLVWDRISGEIRHRYIQHTQPNHQPTGIRSVAFHPTQSILAMGGDDRLIRLADLATDEIIMTLEGHSHPIQSLAFSPDGRILASCAWHDRVRLWDVATGQLQTKLSGKLDDLRSLSFSADGRYLAGGGDNRQSQVWDVSTGQSIGILKNHAQAIQAVAFSRPDSNILATGSEDKTIQLWDISRCLPLKTCQPLQTLRGYDYWVHAIALSPDGQQIVAAGDDGTMRFWPVSELVNEAISEPGLIRPMITGPASRLWAIAYSPNGQYLASAGDDKMVCLWRVQTGELVGQFSHADWVRAIAFSPDGRWLATGSTDHLVRRWDIHTGECQTFKGHRNWIRRLVFSQDGQSLCSAGDDGDIIHWSLGDGAIVDRWNTGAQRIWSIGFDPTGEILVSGSDEGTVQFWDWRNAKRLGDPLHQKIPIRAMALHPTEPIMAIAGTTAVIALWDISDRSQPRQIGQDLVGHESWVRSLVFHPTLPLLFSGSQDSQIGRWHWPSQVLEGFDRPDRPYERMNITELRGLSGSQENMLKQLGARVEPGDVQWMNKARTK